MVYYQSPYMQADSRSSFNRQQQGKMTIAGTGKVNVMPDQAVINIGVMTEDHNAEIAQNENAAISNKVISSLREIGILDNDIQTISYTIQPIYDYVDGKSNLKGYQVRHQFEVTVRDLKKTGEVYEAAVSAGANMAGSLRFEASNKEAYYQKSLQLALKNASEKAVKLGQQIGVTVNLIPTKIIEETTSFAPRELTLAFSEEATLQAVPPIQRSQIEIQAKITAVFQY